MHSLSWAQDGDVPEADQEEDTPVTHEEIAGEKGLTGSRPWRAPDYTNQDSAMGWNEKAFEVPKGLETQVQFWIDIYSKYNSDQGVLHDAENIDFIYGIIDFSSITRQADLSEGKKQALKKKLVKNEKTRIIDILKKLDKIKDPSGLEGDEKKIWDYFTKVDEKNKFIVATKKNRLRFQLGQKDRIVQGVYFSGRYLEDFEKIFREAGIPMELTRLVFVESSFNVLARSKVGASGLFQLMRYTAKPYMMMNSAIDKRNHPLEAAKVGAKLLKINYNMLESWPLAVTGWNHGPSGIARLTKKYKTRELSELIDNVVMKKRFGFASRNFYASFLAVLEVEKNAPKYLGTVAWSQPLESADLKIKKPLKYSDILKWFDGDDMKAQIYNPHISSLARKGKTAIPKGALLSVPKAKYDEVVMDLKSL
jgi:membrane-bound lytic murein transglycosylase D